MGYAPRELRTELVLIGAWPLGHARQWCLMIVMAASSFRKLSEHVGLQPSFKLGVTMENQSNTYEVAGL